MKIRIKYQAIPCHYIFYQSSVKYHAYVICRLQKWDGWKKMYILLCDNFLAIHKFC